MYFDVPASLIFVVAFHSQTLLNQNSRGLEVKLLIIKVTCNLVCDFQKVKPHINKVREVYLGLYLIYIFLSSCRVLILLPAMALFTPMPLP
jgi:hypothetical protein